MNTAKLANGVLALGLLLAILMLAACGETGGEDPGEEQETVVVTQPAEDASEGEGEPAGAGETAREPQATGPEEDEGQAGGETGEPAGGEAEAGQSPPVTAAGEPAELRDGVWTVGDAGEVEFALENGVLSLVDVRPATGWAVEIDEEAADEIEVEFEQNATEWEFEVEVDQSNMEIELKQDIEPAQAGTYQLGDAGEVEFQFDGSALTLVDVRAQEGWNAVVDEEAADEIEVDFMFGNVEWEFEAEVDNGELEVEIDQKISGPIPNQ